MGADGSMHFTFPLDDWVGVWRRRGQQTSPILHNGSTVRVSVKNRRKPVLVRLDNLESKYTGEFCACTMLKYRADSPETLANIVATGLEHLDQVEQGYGPSYGDYGRLV